MSGLVILAPPGAIGDPKHWDVTTGGPPDDQLPTTAVATWEGGVSVSWFHTRTYEHIAASGYGYWTLVLEALDDLDAPPFDYTGRRFGANNVTVDDGVHGMVTRRILPHLGITLIEFRGLDQSAVVLVPGAVDQLPTSVRLIPVEMPASAFD